MGKKKKRTVPSHTGDAIPTRTRWSLSWIYGVEDRGINAKAKHISVKKTESIISSMRDRPAQ